MSAQRANQLVEAGLWLRLSGDHEGARRLFEQALKLDPDNARARQLVEAQTGGSTPQPPPVAPPPKPPEAKANPFVRSDATTAAAGQGDWGFAGFFDKPAAPPAKPNKPMLTPPPVSPMLSDAKTAWDSKSNPGKEVSSSQEGIGGAMDLLADEDSKVNIRSPLAGEQFEREEVRTLLRGAKDLLELDDHSGAMDLILKAQEISPEDPDVKQMRENSERVLQNMFESKLGTLTAVPRVALKDDEIIWLNLDHRAGFVLAQIDGTVSFEDLFAVSGMSRLDTARILAQLVDEGVIVR